MESLNRTHLLRVLFSLAICAPAICVNANNQPRSTRTRDWVLPASFHVTVDAEGFRFPTAIAFVPDPGHQPKDPLYFVSELRGKIKVVTNDRTVYTFADLAADSFAFQPERELPSGYGQGGLAGICLAPEQGYVFATFLYRDAQGELRNNIVRFGTSPHSFAGEPAGKRYFTDLFSEYHSGLHRFVVYAEEDTGTIRWLEPLKA